MIFGNIIDYESFDIKHLITLFPELFRTYDYQIISKTKTTGYYMDWHLDDAHIISHTKNHIKTLIGHDKHIPISDKHTLYYYDKKPIYSLIIYEHTFNKDFTGGTLEFYNNIIIYPKKGDYVLFNSNDLHRVNPMTSGIRSTHLIKFY